MTVKPADYVTVTLTDDEVAHCVRVVTERKGANKGRAHSPAYRAGAATGVIDTSVEGSFAHEVRSAAVELATAKWLGARKAAGTNVWHAAEVTYPKKEHTLLSETRWSCDVWVFGADSDGGRIVDEDWIQFPFDGDRRVTRTVEVKKTNPWLGSGKNDLLAGQRLEHGGAIVVKDVGFGSLSVVGQASEDFRTVVLAGWFPLNETTFDRAKWMKYSPSGESRQARAKDVLPMQWLPVVAMPKRFTGDDVAAALRVVLGRVAPVACGGYDFNAA